MICRGKQEEDNVKVSAPLFCTVDMLKKNFFLGSTCKKAPFGAQTLVGLKKLEKKGF